MNRKGNKTIGKTKKYDKEQRRLITRLIRKEWDGVKGNNPSSDEFAQQALKNLAQAGVKSPDGQSLTLRGVKYQVQRSGIKFKGRMSRLSRTAPKVVPAPKQRETIQDRQDMVASLQAIPTALRGILEDNSISGEQRTAMFAAYFELRPKL